MFERTCAIIKMWLVETSNNGRSPTHAQPRGENAWWGRVSGVPWAARAEPRNRLREFQHTRVGRALLTKRVSVRTQTSRYLACVMAAVKWAAAMQDKSVFRPQATHRAVAQLDGLCFAWRALLLVLNPQARSMIFSLPSDSWSAWIRALSCLHLCG